MMRKYNFVLLKNKVGQLLKLILDEVTKGTLRLVTTPPARSLRPPSKSMEGPTKLQMRRQLKEKNILAGCYKQRAKCTGFGDPVLPHYRVKYEDVQIGGIAPTL